MPHNDVADKSRAFIHDYVEKFIDTNDLFRSIGHAYVRIAKEDPHIFKLYLFQERQNIFSLDDLYYKETNPGVAKMIAENLNISIPAAKKLHLNMLIYTIGIGTIYSVTSSTIPENEIFSLQEKAYQTFLKTTLEEEENE